MNHDIPRSALDVIVYDIEIARCIPDRRAPREPGLDYCAGWDDHANMGIAVLCAYDLRADEPRIFLADNLAAFGELIDGRVVAGFNNRGFDDKLLAANGIRVGQSVDLLCAIRRAVGEPEVYTYGITRPGRTLEALSAANLGASKSLSGALAPVEWQRGRRGIVIDYCQRDVMLTVRLLRKLPTLIDPVTRTEILVDLALEKRGAA